MSQGLFNALFMGAKETASAKKSLNSQAILGLHLLP